MDIPLVRIDKGGARPEELAAVTALLMARAAARPSAATTSRSPRVSWRRLERVRGYRAPLSWQS